MRFEFIRDKLSELPRKHLNSIQKNPLISNPQPVEWQRNCFKGERGMGHHHHDSDISGKRLLTTMFLNFLITGVEIAGGILSGSLSLISDALHNFSDGISIVISWIALRLSKRPNTEQFTFGLKRAQILAAVFNSATLIAISLFLFREAWIRFRHPSQINGNIMVLVALVGLTANILGTLLLHQGARRNMNIRSSYLHLLSDAISSAGVILGGICIALWNITWVDPLLTVLISAYILKESLDIVREATGILLMKAPAGLDLKAVCDFVESMDGISNLHHVHAWQLDEHNIHFEGHAEINDMNVSEAMPLLDRIEVELSEKFGIQHVTIQLETGRGHCQAVIANGKDRHQQGHS